MDNLTLGSLFDGSGGFPLGGLISGITPVWASEIEPFPIRVTTKRLPFMKHYGDISQMDGGKIEPVDIITFGSPCQDMSVAGKRSGLDGERSSLFYEAIRIVKEMRCATNGKYPRYIVWENVPGAFSSNKGEDFKAVLEAVIGIAEPDAQVPMPEKAKWPYADVYMGDGWSIAYRPLDAQYWGVPQRRKRIFLVADFAGRGAGKVLFESEGVSGYSAESFRAWQGAARHFESCARTPSIRLSDRDVIEAAGFCTEHSAKARSIGYEKETSPTLRAGVVPAAIALENHPTDRRVKVSTGGMVQTLPSRMGTGGNNVPLVLKIRSGCEGGGKGALIQEDRSATLSCNNDQTVFVPSVYDGKQVTSKTNRSNPQPGAPCHTLAAGSADSTVVCYGICSDKSNAMLSDNPRSGVYEANSSRTLDANGGNPSCNQGGIAVVESYVLQSPMIGREDKNGFQGDGVDEDIATIDRHAVYAMTTGEFAQFCKERSPTLMARDYKAPTLVAEGFTSTIQNGYTVRRLMPTECARLQGFPDWWCDDLGIDEPAMEDIRYWYDVFETHRKIMGTFSKPKTQKQIAKWLKKPYSDAAEYKMWGNGVALPCVAFVLCGIVWYAQNTG